MIGAWFGALKVRYSLAQGNALGTGCKRRVRSTEGAIFLSPGQRPGYSVKIEFEPCKGDIWVVRLWSECRIDDAPSGLRVNIRQTRVKIMVKTMTSQDRALRLYPHLYHCRHGYGLSMAHMVYSIPGFYPICVNLMFQGWQSCWSTGFSLLPGQPKGWTPTG